MSTDNTTVPSPKYGSDEDDDVLVPALVIIWSALQPWRVGEVALLDKGNTFTICRGNEDLFALSFGQQRPGSWFYMGPLVGEKLSCTQCRRTSGSIGFRCESSRKGP